MDWKRIDESLVDIKRIFTMLNLTSFNKIKSLLVR